jgi:CRISPR-associated protein Csb2
MWVVAPGQEPVPNWLPDAPLEDIRMRVTAAGTLRSLEDTFNAAAIERYEDRAAALTTAKGKAKATLKRELEAEFPGGPPESRRPQLVLWQGYGRAAAARDAEQIATGPFDENVIVLTKREGPTLGLESTLQLTEALRNSAMIAAGEPAPEWVSGHDSTGAPSRRPHLACFPLPHVGFEHADGHVMGLGIAIPGEITAKGDWLRSSLGSLFFDPATGEERDIHLWRNRIGSGNFPVKTTRVWDWTLEREKRERPPWSLQRLSWTRASRIWASVTPVVLHHYPKNRNGDVERIV